VSFSTRFSTVEVLLLLVSLLLVHCNYEKILPHASWWVEAAGGVIVNNFLCSNAFFSSVFTMSFLVLFMAVQRKPK
jgi:hypothetical protein